MICKENKIKSISQIAKIAGRARAKGFRLVTTNGTFDILHIGHVRNLKAAKSYGDVLIVGAGLSSSGLFSRPNLRRRFP